MSDEVETGDNSELEPQAAAERPAPGVRERRRRASRSRIISALSVVAGIAAILIAVNQYQHRGYYTPSNVGYVPGDSSSSPAALNSAPQTTAPATTSRPHSKSPSPSKSKTHTKSNSSSPTRPVMPPPIMQLSLDSLGIKAPVISVSTVGGAIDVPADPNYVGIWDQGARPTWKRGSVVIDGHVDSAEFGDGAFFNLDSIAMGSTVSIQYNGKTSRWKLVGRRVYVKDVGLPASVFNMNTDLRLVLITCGGPFDRSTGNYLDNVVVYGVPA
jgi:hypothetical protein